jgi:NAD(P)-dependent dehydrogenase (short-subunit alcohol dehydrogenase family)
MVAAIQSRHDVGAENTKAWLANIPMGRFGEPFEIASVIAFLLGSESSFMSGQCVRVGGGEGE